MCVDVRRDDRHQSFLEADAQRHLATIATSDHYLLVMIHPALAPFVASASENLTLTANFFCAANQLQVNLIPLKNYIDIYADKFPRY